MKNSKLKTIQFLLIISLLAPSVILAGISDEYIELLTPLGQVSADGQLEVDVNEEVLNGFFPSKLKITLPNGSIVYASKSSEEKMIQGFKAWYGHVEGEELSSVVFVQQTGAIMGQIHIRNGRFLIEQISGDKHIIRDLSRLSNRPDHNSKNSPQYTEVLSDVKKSLNISENSMRMDKAGSAQVTVVDILRRSYFYDPPYETSCSGQRLLQNAITNQALMDSGANVRIKLSGCWVAAPYNSDYYDWLQTIHGVAESYDFMLDLRDRLGIDLFMIVAITGDDECTYTPGYPTSYIGVVQEGFDCANRYPYQKVIGRLLGAGFESGGGAFPYSRGFIAPGDQFKTIVTYQNTAPYIPYYSTPLVSYGGIPIGADQSSPSPADNVLTMNQIAPIVAGYRSGPIRRLFAVIEASPGAGIAPLDVFFDASASYHSDPAITITDYEWDFDDGSAKGYGPTINHTYQSVGDYSVRLRVTDSLGKEAVANTTVKVLNPGDLLVRVAPLKPYIKANERETGTISAFVRESTTGNLITQKMNMSFSADLGTLTGEVLFNKSTAKYSQTILSGEPGIANITATVDNQTSGNCQIHYAWPQPPSNPRVEYTTNKSLFKGLHSVNLYWQKNMSDLYTPMIYRIYRSADGGSFQLIAELPTSRFEYTENSLPAGPVYKYVLTTVDIAGDESVHSTELEVR